MMAWRGRRLRGGDVGKAVLGRVPEKFRCGCAAEVVGALAIKVCTSFEEDGPQALKFGIGWVINSVVARGVVLG